MPASLGTACRAVRFQYNSEFIPAQWSGLGVLLVITSNLPVHNLQRLFGQIPMAFMKKKAARKGMVRKRAKTRVKIKKKDPIFVDGVRPRPMFVDYKDVELLKKLINRHGKIVSRRKTGCTAVSQHAVTTAIKRARFMALLPYVGE